MLLDVQVKESAGSESRERVYVSAAEEHDLSGSKGTANFVSVLLTAMLLVVHSHHISMDPTQQP